MSRKINWSEYISGLVGFLATCSWVGACFVYVERHVDWSLIPSLYERGLIIGGIVFPPLLLWCWLLFYGRGKGVSQEVSELLLRMNEMTYPDDASARRVREITQSLKQQTDDLNQASAFADERIGGLLEVFGRYKDSLGELTSKVASQTDQVHEAILTQESSLNRASDAFEKALERSQRVVDSKVRALEGLGARSEAMAQGIADTLGAAVKHLDEAVRRAISQTEEAGDLLKQQAESMAAAGTTAEISCEAMRESLRQDLEVLTQVQERVNDEVERHKRLIRNRMQEVEAILQGVGGRLEGLCTSLAERNEAMDETLASLGRKTDSFFQKLHEDVVAIEHSLQENTEKAQDFAKTFRSESNLLGAQARSVSETLETVTHDLLEAVAEAGREEASRLTEATARAQDSLLRAADSIKPSIESLHEGSEKMNDLADVIMGGVAEQVHEISHVHHEARSSLESFNNAIQEQGYLIEAAAEKAKRGTNEVIKVYQAQTEALAEGAQAANLAVQDLRKGVHEEIDAFRSLTGEYKELLDETRQTVDSRVQLLRESSRDTRDTGDRLRREMDNQRKRLEKMAESSLLRIDDISKRTEKVIETMDSSTSGALMKSAELLTNLQRQSGIINDSVETAEQATGRLVAELGRRSKDLQQATEAALRQGLSLKEDCDSVKRNLFLRTATLLIEDINSSAIELNRFLDDDVPEEYWKRYQKGERGIFARNILKKKDRFTVKALKDYYERNRDFRDAVNCYLDQFDSLLEQARGCDSNDVLTATFMTADVGKLYLLLSRSLGRGD